MAAREKGKRLVVDDVSTLRVSRQQRCLVLVLASSELTTRLNRTISQLSASRLTLYRQLQLQIHGRLQYSYIIINWQTHLCLVRRDDTGECSPVDRSLCLLHQVPSHVTESTTDIMQSSYTDLKQILIALFTVL